MDEVEATDTKWLWYPYIPYGKITIIQGDPGEGKTTLVLHLAAELTQGKMFESEEQQEPVTVIYQTAEDGLADTIKPRLIAANADCSKVLVIDETEQCVSMTDGRLEAAIQQTNAKLVILDPIQAYLGAAVDMHRANQCRDQCAECYTHRQRRQSGGDSAPASAGGRAGKHHDLESCQRDRQ